VQVQRMTYKDYWGYYWRVISRHGIPGIAMWDENLVELIERSCSPPKGGAVLDLGCAGGDQARLFSRRGYAVTGVDWVPSLIEYAQAIYLQEGLHGTFIVGDIRNIEYQQCFDLCVMLSGTFGFPTAEEDDVVLRKIYQALRSGGYAFIDYLPIEQYSRMQRKRSWHPIEGGYSLAEEWYDPLSSTYRTRHIHILLEGRIIEAADEGGRGADEIIRCYGAQEIERNVRAIGFRVAAHLSRSQMEKNEKYSDPDEIPSMLVVQKEE
jgi:SAM-dependent methyltransferase